jgi:hypothetical protein
MGSDACFFIGAAHHICQDYAIAGAHNGSSYAILSDGCSGKKVGEEPGSPFTDFGSRFLSRAARSCLPEPGRTLDYKEILERGIQMAAACRLKATALEATLLVAVQRNREIEVFQMGDGVVAARRRGTGEVHYTSLKFGNNAPFYLACLLSTAAKANYISKAETVATTTGILSTSSGLMDAMEMLSVKESTVEEKLSNDSPCMRVHNFNTADYDLVLVMSDGAESFVDRKNEPVPLPFVLRQIFAFKGYEGEFIRRRSNGFKKFCVEHGWRHDDDLSIAGIYLPNPDEQAPLEKTP